MNYYGYRDIISTTMEAIIDEVELESFENFSTQHERLIPFEYAVRRATRWQKDHPAWFVCGSVALMAAGYMPKGNVADIDFVTNEFPGSYHQPYKGHYVFPKAGEESFSPYYHYEPAGADGQICLFVFPNPSDRVLEESYFHHGLNIQRIDDILKWKKLFNRQKDIDDLDLIISHDVLPDELFEI